MKAFSANTRLSSIKPATSKAVKHLVALPNRFRKFREWERELPAGPPHGCRPGPHATKFNGQSSKTKPHKMFLVGPKVEIVAIDHFTCTPFSIPPWMDQDDALQRCAVTYTSMKVACKRLLIPHVHKLANVFKNSETFGGKRHR